MVVKESSIRRTRLGSVGVLALLGLAVSSQGCAEDPPRQPPPGPPRAAIDACLYKSFSASCYFEDGVHAITGTCQEHGRDWVCVPDRPPPAGRPMPGGPGSAGLGAGSAAAAMPLSSASGVPERAPRPPREAFDACLERAQGSACRVRTPQGEIAGRCVTEPQGLACIPTDPNHRPGEEGGPAFGLH
ncbi:hypothetical protein [Allochromatium tepidum]|uniref:DUF333 domain-containing protein n=1 Tax=Allochromatium tepidum TaxID=553982 RepID=A0ABN6GCD5_9GAMM|nr:hypothetical protein [Allochromatium tepidum]BCU06774.1 hypothetical protein Atep_14510 [Allochromatium tepidum]